MIFMGAIFLLIVELLYGLFQMMTKGERPLNHLENIVLGCTMLLLMGGMCVWLGKGAFQLFKKFILDDSI